MSNFANRKRWNEPRDSQETLLKDTYRSGVIRSTSVSSGEGDNSYKTDATNGSIASELSTRTGSTVQQPPTFPDGWNFRRKPLCNPDYTNLPQQSPPTTQSTFPQHELRHERAICCSCGIRIDNQDRRPKPCLRTQCLCVIILISIATSVISTTLATMNAIFVFMPVIEDHIFNKGDYETCLPCDDLTDNTPDTLGLKDNLFKITKNNIKMCCATNSGQMSALIQSIMNQPETVKEITTPKPRYHYSPISAHLQLDPCLKAGESGNDGQMCTLEMKMSIYNRRLHAENINVLNARMQLVVSGLYLVYFSIFHHTKGEPCSILPNKTFTHVLMRKEFGTNNGLNTLLRSDHTCCTDCDRDEHTSYTAGIFRLNTNDTIYIETTGEDYITFLDRASYVGLVLIRNLEN